LPCSPLHIVRTKGSVTSLCVVKKFRKKSFGDMAWCRLPWRAHQERCDLSPGWVGRNRRPLLGSLHRYGDITSPLVEMFRTGGPVNKSRRSPRVVRRAVAESPGLVRDAESLDAGQICRHLAVFVRACAPWCSGGPDLADPFPTVRSPVGRGTPGRGGGREGSGWPGRSLSDREGEAATRPAGSRRELLLPSAFRHDRLAADWVRRLPGMSRREYPARCAACGSDQHL
jgi:hypothetical protein